MEKYGYVSVNAEYYKALLKIEAQYVRELESRLRFSHIFEP